MWIAFGVAALIVALALAAVLIRLRGTLGAVEELLDTTNEEMKETLPEVRQTIENVNDITSGVNVGLRTGGRGMAAVGRGISAAVHGVGVAGKSLVRSVKEPRDLGVRARGQARRHDAGRSARAELDGPRRAVDRAHASLRQRDLLGRGAGHSR